MNVRRRIYIAALVLWLAYGILYPTWTGRSYNPETPINPSRWFYGGTFALKEGDSMAVRPKAPIWNPPVPYSDGIEAKVRWPWQPVAHHDSIELNMVAMAFRWSAGVIALGVAFFVFNRIRPAKKPDLVLTIAWTAALWQMIAWLCNVALIAASTGAAATDEVMLWLLSGAGLAGIVHGVLLSTRKRPAPPLI